MATLKKQLWGHLHDGTVIPAHPLALTADRELDEESQRLLSRYYINSGAGGIAVGVHSTQFEIRDPRVNLYTRVLEMASEEVAKAKLDRLFIKVAGICGPTAQATKEAQTALDLGYDIGLLSLGGLNTWSEAQLLQHVRAVGELIPIFGFYLQPAVGGRLFSYGFWRQFAEIPAVAAIKVASFNRYQTLDVMRAVAASSRTDEIAMYTGNDDNIVADLLSTYSFEVNGTTVNKEFVGGLLGHWAVWTSMAVSLLKDIKAAKRVENPKLWPALLARGVEITDVNAAIFDPSHDFHGCIPGIHEVLRRQGLLKGTWCLNPEEQLSGGQYEEISRVHAAYPHLHDDDFVTQFLNTQKTP